MKARVNLKTVGATRFRTVQKFPIRLGMKFDFNVPFHPEKKQSAQI